MFPWLKKQVSNNNHTAYAPDNTRIYAVGDIHGRFDLLKEIQNLIVADAISCPDEIRKVIIYIGDYIDRGLESRQVIDSFINNKLEGFEHIFIMGNHEYAMLNFLDNPIAGQVWLSWGGLATMHSYGVNNNEKGRKLNLEELCEAFKAAMPDSHLEFFRNLKVQHTEGDYLFVHAGIKPNVDIEKQTDTDMMMIREEFLFSDYPSKLKTIVFGHTIFEEPFYTTGKVAIDTGAYATGKLTAAVLEDNFVKFIST